MVERDAQGEGSVGDESRLVNRARVAFASRVKRASPGALTPPPASPPGVLSPFSERLYALQCAITQAARRKAVTTRHFKKRPRIRKAGKQEMKLTLVPAFLPSLFHLFLVKILGAVNGSEKPDHAARG